MIEFLSQPWAWYVSGPLIAFILFLQLFFGKKFGMSTNLKTACTIAGAEKLSDYFNTDWKSQSWSLTVVVGTVIGGFIAMYFLHNPEPMALSEATVQRMEGMGFINPGKDLMPSELFSLEAIGNFKGLMLLLVGGFLVGFGARYAEGCTSGHAISGLSNLQLPSLIAVIGFFIGGLIMSHFLLPFLL